VNNDRGSRWRWFSVEEEGDIEGRLVAGFLSWNDTVEFNPTAIDDHWTLQRWTVKGRSNAWKIALLSERSQGAF